MTRRSRKPCIRNSFILGGLPVFLSFFQVFFRPRSLQNINSISFLDTLKTTTPLLTKVILIWLEESYFYYRTPPEERGSLPFSKPKGLGYGIGLAFALFAMQGTFFVLGSFLVVLSS